MKTMSSSSSWQSSLALWRHFKEHLALDSKAFGIAIQATAVAKLWRSAISLLEEMQGQELTPSAVCSSVAISACAQLQEWEARSKFNSHEKRIKEESNKIKYLLNKQ